MKSREEDAAVFREECLKWQKRLNLLHWTLSFTAATGDSNDEALCEYDCDTREATLTYYIGVPNVSHPKDNALHEMLHLLLADALRTAVEEGTRVGENAEDSKLLAREEHKVISVLEKVLK